MALRRKPNHRPKVSRRAISDLYVGIEAGDLCWACGCRADHHILTTTRGGRQAWSCDACASCPFWVDRFNWHGIAQDSLKHRPVDQGESDDRPL